MDVSTIPSVRLPPTPQHLSALLQALSNKVCAFPRVVYADPQAIHGRVQSGVLRGSGGLHSPLRSIRACLRFFMRCMLRCKACRRAKKKRTRRILSNFCRTLSQVPPSTRESSCELAFFSCLFISLCSTSCIGNPLFGVSLCCPRIPARNFFIIGRRTNVAMDFEVTFDAEGV